MTCPRHLQLIEKRHEIEFDLSPMQSFISSLLVAVYRFLLVNVCDTQCLYISSLSCQRMSLILIIPSVDWEAHSMFICRDQWIDHSCSCSALRKRTTAKTLNVTESLE